MSLFAAQNLKRAAHITQMLRAREIAPTLSASEARNVDVDESIQLLEFCKHGDLMALMEKIDDKEPMAVKHVLKIFACRKLHRNALNSITEIAVNEAHV